MDRIEINTEISANIKKNKNDLLELCEAYELAKIGYDANVAQNKDLANKVLAENEFFVSEEASELNMKKGDRIINEMYDFLMSEDETKKYISLLTKAHYEAGLCDEKGVIITDWIAILGTARRTLYDYLVEKILPSEYRAVFREKRLYVSTQEKLINIFLKSIK